jgi:hypothetical protein
VNLLSSLLLLALACGCETPTLYEWGDYDQWLYENYKNPKDDEELYVDLTALITAYDSRPNPATKPMAPGIYAEYGFLLMRRGETARALAELETLPRPTLAEAGPELGLLRGYLLHGAGEFDEAIEQLEAIAREQERFPLTHPELYYFLARAHDARLHFDKALRNMRVFVDASSMLPEQWLREPPEPPAGAAATTDAPGETLKNRHAGHPQDPPSAGGKSR